MKKLNLISTFLLFALTLSTYAQIPERFQGTWNFDAPTADYGYKTGIMDIKKDKVIISFTNNSYEYPSDWAKFESDTLKFNFDLDGAYVKCVVNIKDASNLKGNAEWDMGETKLLITREETQ